MKRLYDASALVNLLLTRDSKSLLILCEEAVLDLTAYETGNVLWKLSCLQKKITKIEACELLDVCLDIISSMTVLSISGIEKDVKEASITTGASFYDSAYAVLAKKYDLELVTDDKKLQKIVASNYRIRVSSSDKL